MLPTTVSVTPLGMLGPGGVAFAATLSAGHSPAKALPPKAATRPATSSARADQVTRLWKLWTFMTGMSS